MSRPRINIGQIREVLRLSLTEQRSIREISRATSLPKSTVSDYVKRAKEAGLSWPLPEDLDDDALESRLFGASVPAVGAKPMPDLSYLHRELKRPHMTLMLLWVEYREEHPDGYGYTQFCEYYRRFAGTLSPTMRQRHVSGAKTFVDFAGDTLPIYGPDDEVEFYAQIFVAVLEAGGTYACSAFARMSRFDFDRLIIDQTLYWTIVDSEDEALYISGLFNSDGLDQLIKDFQPHGQFGRRHVHELPTKVTPGFNPCLASHMAVVNATRALLVDVELARLKPKFNKTFDPAGHLPTRRAAMRAEVLAKLPAYAAYAAACRELYGID